MNFVIRRISCVFVTTVFLASCFVSVSGEVAAKPPSKDPGGGDWGVPQKNFRGFVKDRASLFNIGGGIPVRVDWYYNSNYYYRLTTTDSTGYFIISMKTAIYGSGTLFRLYVNYGNTAGYWSEYREMSLPSVGQWFGLLGDTIGYFYPFQSFSHTNMCKLGYDTAETTTVTTAILPGEAVGYTWTRTTTIGGTYHSDFSWSSAVMRYPFMSTGMFMLADPISAPLGTVNVIDYWLIGNPLNNGEWGDYMTDPYTYLPPSPPNGEIKISASIAPGGSWEWYDSTTKIDGWTGAFSVPIPYVGTMFHLGSFQKTGGGTNTLSAYFLNNDPANVYHTYAVWVQGPILHAWVYS